MKNPLNFLARRRECETLDREIELSLSGDWMERIPERAQGEPEYTAEELAQYQPLLSETVAEAFKQAQEPGFFGWIMVGAQREGLPPSFWEGLDPYDVVKGAKRLEETAELREQDLAGLTPDSRRFIESGGPAALALLACLEGRDGDPEVIQDIMDQRARNAGLDVEFARRDSGFMIGNGPKL